jgi:hypothetical protein
VFFLVEKNNNNSICLTLNEKMNVNYPETWLFRFVNEQSKKEYYCNLTDLSTSKKRFNLFNLYEGTSITLPVGEYMYYVYQMEIENENNYNLGFLCEQGKAKVKSNVATVIPTFTQTTIIKQIYE